MHRWTMQRMQHANFMLLTQRNWTFYRVGKVFIASLHTLLQKYAQLPFLSVFAANIH